MDDAYPIAARLRTEYAASDELVSFTHVPVQVSPSALLAMLRDSHLAPVVAAEDSALTHPEQP